MVVIVTVTGQTYYLNHVTNNDRVQRLYSEACKVLNVGNVRKISLVFQGVVLEDEYKKIWEYGIGSNSSVNVVMLLGNSMRSQYGHTYYLNQICWRCEKNNLKTGNGVCEGCSKYYKAPTCDFNRSFYSNNSKYTNLLSKINSLNQKRKQQRHICYLNLRDSYTSHKVKGIKKKKEQKVAQLDQFTESIAKDLIELNSFINEDDYFLKWEIYDLKLEIEFLKSQKVNKILQVNNKCNLLEQKISGLSQENTQLKEKNTYLEGVFRSKQNQLVEGQEDMKQIEQMLQIKQKEINSLKEKLQTLDQEKISKDYKIVQLELTQERYQQFMNQYKAEVQQLKAELKKYNPESMQLTIDTKCEQIEELKRECERKAIQIEELKDQLERYSEPSNYNFSEVDIQDIGGQEHYFYNNDPFGENQEKTESNPFMKKEEEVEEHEVIIREMEDDQKECAKLFDSIDENGDGRISNWEYINYLQKLRITCDYEQIEQIFEKFGTDGSMSEEQFQQYFNSVA